MENEKNYIRDIYKYHNDYFNILNEKTDNKLELNNDIKIKIAKLQKEITELQNTAKNNEQEYNIYIKYRGRNGNRFYDVISRLQVSEDIIDDLDLVIDVNNLVGEIYIPIDIQLEKGLIFLQEVKYRIVKDKISIVAKNNTQLVDLFNAKNGNKYHYGYTINHSIPTNYLYYKLYNEIPKYKYKVQVEDLLGSEKIYKLNTSQDVKEQLILNNGKSMKKTQSDLSYIDKKDKTINMLYLVKNDNERQIIDELNCLKDYSNFVSRQCGYSFYLDIVYTMFDKFIPLYTKVKEHDLEFKIYGINANDFELNYCSTFYHSYQNVKDTLNYNMYIDTIIRLTLNEGFRTLSHCAGVLKDYINMYKTCNNELPVIEGNFEGLQLKHDKLSREYNIKLAQEQEELFAKNQEYLKNKDLGQYTIVVPRTSEEIKQEASMQNNCVASYIAGVVENKYNIVFLRKNEDLTKSYITVEITNGKICQAKRKFNKHIDDVDYNLLKRYADYMKLEISEKL